MSVLASTKPPAAAAPSKAREDDAEPQVCLPEHCFHAFDALFCALTQHEPVPPQFPDDKYPLFVTWNTRLRGGRAPRLRGCIGTFEPLPLREGLAEYALVSAFRDSRFARIERHELESLECGISLLTDFEDATSYLDWTVGVHGIHISFPPPPTLSPASASASGAPSPLSSSTAVPTRARLPGRTYTATYLPQIAPEQGWDRVEAVDSAIRKAGYTGRITEDVRRSIRLRRYQSRKCTVGWDEYVRWRVAQGGEI